MSDLVSMLRQEQRRHFAISFGIVAAGIIAGTMVTNERGVFSAIGGGPLSAFERAFSAILGDDGQPPNLFRRNTPSAPLGYGPVKALGTPGGLPRRPADVVPGNQLPDIVTQQITPDQIASNAGPGGVPFGNDFPGGPQIFNPGPGLGLVNPSEGSPSPDGPPSTSTPPPNNPPAPPTEAVPEPAAWALMISGFGLIGWLQRRSGSIRRRRAFLRGE